MYSGWKLRKKGAIFYLPMYLDSPMRKSILKIFKLIPTWHKLPIDVCEQMLKDITQMRTVQETYKLAASNTPEIIIAARGMASGGRVLTYFVQYPGKPSATILPGKISGGRHTRAGIAGRG